VKTVIQYLEGILYTLARFHVELDGVVGLKVGRVAPGGRREAEVHPTGQGPIRIYPAGGALKKRAGDAKPLIGFEQGLPGERTTVLGQGNSASSVEQLRPLLLRLETATEEAWRNPRRDGSVIDVNELHGAESGRHVAAAEGAVWPALNGAAPPVKPAQEILGRCVVKPHHLLKILQNLCGQAPP
jgi:hypothetical protein